MGRLPLGQHIHQESRIRKLDFGKDCLACLRVETVHWLQLVPQVLQRWGIRRGSYLKGLHTGPESVQVGNFEMDYLALGLLVQVGEMALSVHLPQVVLRVLQR